VEQEVRPFFTPKSSLHKLDGGRGLWSASLQRLLSNRPQRPQRSRQAASWPVPSGGASVGARMKSSISMSGPT
jgi:hypothetical protein